MPAQTAPGETPCLRIRRFDAEYLVAAQHPAPERLKARLDEAIARDLGEALSRFLGPAFPEAEPGLWLIRQLEVAVDVNGAWERDTLARAWAERIAQTLDAALRGGADGANVLWFPDQAAYLARFLADAAEGRAWSRWYYQAFDGLRLLPTSAALRTAVCDRPATGHAALLQLSVPEVAQLLRALTPHDARWILDSCAAETPAGEELRGFQAVWEAMEADMPAFGDESRDALGLFLAAGRGRPDADGPALRTAALALLRLARRLGSVPGARGDLILAELTGGDPAALYQAAGAGDAEALLPLLRCPPDWVRDVGRALLARARGDAMPDAASPATGPRSTPFGGIFLLLPLLDELPLEELTRDWPEAEDTAAAALLRFLLVVKCCGQSGAPAVFFDPLARDLIGVPPSLSPRLLARWGRRISPAHRHAFLERLEAWHVERGAVRNETHLLARVPTRGRPMALLIDGARGLWLGVGGYDPRRPERFDASLRDRLARGVAEETLLLCDPALLETVGSSLPPGSVASLADAVAGILEPADAGIDEILARRDRLPAELAHLALPPAWRISRPLDRTLSVAAQGLLRAFAWRLPGFAGSHLPYLFQNFLDFAGSVEEEPVRRLVRLGRPPLHLVLSLTGMARGVYTLSWQDERPFALFPEG